MSPTFIQWAVTTTLTGLVALLTYVFLQEVKRRDTLSNIFEEHIKEYNENKINITKMLVRLEESFDTQHEATLNSFAVLNQEMVLIRQKFHAQGEQLQTMIGRQLERDKK